MPVAEVEVASVGCDSYRLDLSRNRIHRFRTGWVTTQLRLSSPDCRLAYHLLPTELYVWFVAFS